MSLNDQKTNPDTMWTYYVVDHLPSMANIYRFARPEEAIQCYRSLDPSLRSAIGSSLDGIHEMDHIHRCGNDVPVLVTASDNIESPLWRQSPEIRSAISLMIDELDVRSQRSSDLLGSHLPSVIIDLDRSSDHRLDSYFTHSILLPDQPRQYNSCITQAFVMGHGWLSSDAFFRLVKASTAGRDGIPADLFLERLNIRYLDTRNGYIGEADISPNQFSLLRRRTEHLLSPSVLNADMSALLSAYYERDPDKPPLLSDDMKAGDYLRLLQDLLQDPSLSADMRACAETLHRRALALIPADMRKERLASRIAQASKVQKPDLKTQIAAQSRAAAR